MKLDLRQVQKAVLLEAAFAAYWGPLNYRYQKTASNREAWVFHTLTVHAIRVIDGWSADRPRYGVTP